MDGLADQRIGPLDRRLAALGRYAGTSINHLKRGAEDQGSRSEFREIQLNRDA